MLKLQEYLEMAEEKENYVSIKGAPAWKVSLDANFYDGKYHNHSRGSVGTVLAKSPESAAEAITVWAPDPTTVSYAIDSAVPPPSSGPTDGYGTFATWAETAVFNDQISISVTQVAGGTVALAVLFELFRRIKPVNKTFSIDISGTEYTITDVRQK